MRVASDAMMSLFSLYPSESDDITGLQLVYPHCVLTILEVGWTDMGYQHLQLMCPGLCWSGIEACSRSAVIN